MPTVSWAVSHVSSIETSSCGELSESEGGSGWHKVKSRRIRDIVHHLIHQMIIIIRLPDPLIDKIMVLKVVVQLQTIIEKVTRLSVRLIKRDHQTINKTRHSTEKKTIYGRQESYRLHH